ncbi:hypothetical protein Anas_12801 [Armadillidium nasatum]|uniref:PPAF-2-like Clip domain-containing protein n=1 Tax=Armadillidium nasatum TaxID=96803 RepID=A0A5N5SZB0_9CRUS|nr:hypothetical protein Anas_12801 [Armadillidium nasatum]
MFKMQNFPPLVLALLTTILTAEAQSGNEWWLSGKQYFSTCCECVPFYGCVNNTVNIEKLSNHERSEPVVNVQTCPNIVDYCCKLPNAPQECDKFPFGKMPPEVNRNPQPDKKCECTPWETCPLDNIVTDGKGETSKSLKDIGLISHSKCKDEIEVCCFVKSLIATRRNLPDNPKNSSTVTAEREEECKCVKIDLCSEANPSGEDLIDTRIGRKRCENKDEVCCPLRFIPDEEINSSGYLILSNYFAITFSLLPLIRFT